MGRGQGSNFFPKSGGTNFCFVLKFVERLDRAPKEQESRRRRRRGGRMRGRGFLSLPGRGLWRGVCRLPRKFVITLEKAHFDGYPIHSGVLILKSWFAVHRMLQGCETDSVTSSPTGCSSLEWGLVPYSLKNSAQVCPLSPPHASPPLPFSSVPSPSSPNCQAVHRLRPVHCNVHLWAYTSAVLYV